MKMAVDWSMLPVDIAASIAIKLKTVEDFIYFSAVCCCWNRASGLIKHQWRATPSLPWLLLTEKKKENPNCLRKIFNLDNKKCYSLRLPNTFGTRCWGSAYGWVALLDRNFDIQLFNPISKACLSFPNVGLLHTNKDETDVGEGYISWFLISFVTRLIVLKVSLNCHDGYAIVINYNNYDYDGRRSLAFARDGDQSWTTISAKEIGETIVVDMVAMDDTLFALCDDGSVIYWVLKDFNDLKFIKPRCYLPKARVEVLKILDVLRTQMHSLYMVSCGRDLLMVLRFKDEIPYSDDSADSDDEDDIVYKTIGFQVYKLEPIDKNWVKINDFGEVALFVGGSSSMCVSVEYAEGLRRNCIYFTDDEYQFWGSPIECAGDMVVYDNKGDKLVPERAGRDMGVYDNKDDKLSPLYKGEGMLSSFCPPIFFIPQLI